jgi:hypothetical protein
MVQMRNNADAFRIIIFIDIIDQMCKAYILVKLDNQIGLVSPSIQFTITFITSFLL